MERLISRYDAAAYVLGLGSVVCVIGGFPLIIGATQAVGPHAHLWSNEGFRVGLTVEAVGVLLILVSLGLFLSHNGGKRVKALWKWLQTRWAWTKSIRITTTTKIAAKVATAVAELTRDAAHSTPIILHEPPPPPLPDPLNEWFEQVDRIVAFAWRFLTAYSARSEADLRARAGDLARETELLVDTFFDWDRAHRELPILSAFDEIRGHVPLLGTPITSTKDNWAAASRQQRGMTNEAVRAIEVSVFALRAALSIAGIWRPQSITTQSIGMAKIRIEGVIQRADAANPWLNPHNLLGPAREESEKALRDLRTYLLDSWEAVALLESAIPERGVFTPVCDLNGYINSIMSEWNEAGSTDIEAEVLAVTTQVNNLRQALEANGTPVAVASQTSVNAATLVDASGREQTHEEAAIIALTDGAKVVIQHSRSIANVPWNKQKEPWSSYELKDAIECLSEKCNDARHGVANYKYEHPTSEIDREFSEFQVWLSNLKMKVDEHWKHYPTKPVTLTTSEDVDHWDWMLREFEKVALAMQSHLITQHRP
jgi:hypothetical protein